MTTAGYIETKVCTTTSGAEPVSALLYSHGIEEISVSDRNDLDAIIARPGDWDYIEPTLTEAGKGEAIIRFYTSDDDDGNSLLREVKLSLMKLKSDEQYGQYGDEADFGTLYAESSPLEDDWKEKGASEQSDVFLSSGEKIDIASGMAFGTGDHETTTLCLDALDAEIINRLDTADQHDFDWPVAVLDIGTGTGILAIAAAKLGASAIVAVDNDDESIRVARENFIANGIKASGETGVLPGDNFAEEIALIEGDILESSVRESIADANNGLEFDIIVANLAKNLIVELLPDLSGLLARGGSLVLSGLLGEDEDDVLDAMDKSGFSVAEISRSGEWIAICADF